jgi:radical SAM protein
MKGWPFNEKPLLIFWETTKACLLACKHCRAEAVTEHLPETLSTEEGFNLIEQVAGFGRPYPILVFTGGDPLMREDLWKLVAHARRKGVLVALAPSVTELLDKVAARRIKELGVVSVSISLDGPNPKIHDAIREVPGTFKKTLEVIEQLRSEGVKVQVNTAVMRENAEHLADLAKLLLDVGVNVWEVFYLVPIGRAIAKSDLEPAGWEDVAHFLYEASKYGILVRTVEGPMFRRVSMVRRALEGHGLDPDKVLEVGSLYCRLKERVMELLGKPRGKPHAQTSGTRDGKGVIFVAYDGSVYPSGFLYYPLGNVKKEELAKVYREKPELKHIRAAKFKGRCGRCEFREICGGSRARAYAYYGDLMAEDPACQYEPGSYGAIFKGLGTNYISELSLNSVVLEEL